MKAICIFVAIICISAVFAMCAYVWLKLRGWNITFDSCVNTDAEEPIKRLPARDAKGRFVKKQQ